MKTATLRNWLAIGNYSLIIGVSAVLVGLTVGEMILDYPDRSFTYLGILVFGFIYLFFPFTVGVLHYAVLVRRSIKVAIVIDFLCCFALMLLAIPAFVILSGYLVVEAVSSPFHLWDESWQHLALLLACMGYFIFYYWSNTQLLRFLKSKVEENESQADYGKQAFQFTLREIMIWAVIVSIMASAAGYVIHTGSPGS